MKSKLLPLLAGLCFLTACNDDNNNPIPADGNLFPLAVGNYWEYSPKMNGADHGITRSDIKAIVTIENKDYYMMVTRTESMPTAFIDTTYYRIESNGYVYKRKKSSEEGNIFRLGANDGDSWKFSNLSYENDMHLTSTDPLTVNSTEVANCRLFSFDSPGMADEEQYYYLAPGIGIVATYSAWGFRRELTKAVIDGVEHHF